MKIYSAASKVFESYNVTSFKLKAYKYYHLTAPSLSGLGLSGIVVETTPELIKLQQDLIGAVAPYTVQTGTAAAFVTTPATAVMRRRFTTSRYMCPNIPASI